MRWVETGELRNCPSPILRLLIHGRYLEEGELQKEQQRQALGSEEIQSPADEGAAKPNTEAQVEDTLQQDLGTLGQQQLAEVRFPVQSLLLENRSCMLLLLGKSRDTMPSFLGKGKVFGYFSGLVLIDSGCECGYCFSLSLSVLKYSSPSEQF